MEAKTIWKALQRDHDFQGSYSSVQRFVRRLAATTPDPIVRLEFGPGEVAQVDFGSGPQLPDPVSGKLRKTHVFVMTLAYSRHQYAEIVWDQSVGTWLRCHRNAFEFWGGVPAKVVCDNLKAAIVKHCRYDPLVQRSYGEFAQGYGFIVSACIVRTPEHKGRVESGVRYVTRSFLQSPRTFASLADANHQLLQWVLEEAGNRVHGTIHQMPLALFASEEKAALKPLPAEPVEITVWSTVKLHPDCHVVFEKAYYSAPDRLVGRTLDLRATDSTISLFEGLTSVACHARATRPGQHRTNLDHLPPEKTAYLRQTPRWCLDQAERVGPSCDEFMRRLLSDRVSDRLRAAQGLIRLKDRYGARRLDAACERALTYEHVQYRAVKRILEQGLDQAPIVEVDGGQLELPFVELPRFARSIGDLFPRN
jgi:transposase